MKSTQAPHLVIDNDAGNVQPYVVAGCSIQKSTMFNYLLLLVWDNDAVLTV